MERGWMVSLCCAALVETTYMGAPGVCQGSFETESITCFCNGVCLDIASCDTPNWFVIRPAFCDATRRMVSDWGQWKPGRLFARCLSPLTYEERGKKCPECYPMKRRKSKAAMTEGSATKIWVTFSGCRPLFPKVFPPVAQNAAA